MSTVTLTPFQEGQPLTLWGAKRSVLQEIAASLSTAPALDETKAHILFVGGQGPGIVVKNVLAGATIAYGQAAGVFSDTATATGASGIIVIFNITVPVTGIAEIDISEDNIAGTQHVTVQVGVVTVDGYI